MGLIYELFFATPCKHPHIIYMGVFHLEMRRYLGSIYLAMGFSIFYGYSYDILFHENGHFLNETLPYTIPHIIKDDLQCLYGISNQTTGLANLFAPN